MEVVVVVDVKALIAVIGHIIARRIITNVRAIIIVKFYLLVQDE